MKIVIVAAALLAGTFLTHEMVYWNILWFWFGFDGIALYEFAESLELEPSAAVWAFYSLVISVVVAWALNATAHRFGFQGFKGPWHFPLVAVMIVLAWSLFLYGFVY